MKPFFYSKALLFKEVNGITFNASKSDKSSYPI